MAFTHQAGSSFKVDDSVGLGVRKRGCREVAAFPAARSTGFEAPGSAPQLCLRAARLCSPRSCLCKGRVGTPVSQCCREEYLTHIKCLEQHPAWKQCNMRVG